MIILYVRLQGGELMDSGYEDTKNNDKMQAIITSRVVRKASDCI